MVEVSKLNFRGAREVEAYRRAPPSIRNTWLTAKVELGFWQGASYVWFVIKKQWKFEEVKRWISSREKKNVSTR